MKTIVIDGKFMTSKKKAHEYLAKRLSFPDYYGKNLDALHDCLLDISTPTNIVFYNKKYLDIILNSYAHIMLKTFMHASEENNFLTISLDIDSETENI
ncbi:MAG: barstar family protein [Clostridiaceae bacterium]|nr:barstar family protein [Clostridiaceae bacterium]